MSLKEEERQVIVTLELEKADKIWSQLGVHKCKLSCGTWQPIGFTMLFFMLLALCSYMTITKWAHIVEPSINLAYIM